MQPVALAASMTVRVVDRLSEAPVSALAVSAYEKLANGELVWVARKDTDAEGLVKFDLEGLGSGRVFVFRAMPYGRWVYSDEISGGGAYRFYVGRLQVRVVDGTSGAGKANQTVVLRKWSADGRHVRVLEATTDAQGWVRIDPTGGTDWPYVLTAVSPTDGTEKVSAAYYNGGPHTFVLGNAAVRIVLKDALSGTVLPGLPVEALSVSASGQKTRVSTRTTDASGVASFDLDGVGTGSQYVFRAKPYLQQVETPVITNAGEHVLSAGRLKVTVVDGRNASAYANRDVDLLEEVNGAQVFVAKLRTDANGLLRLDPQELGTRKYRLQAAGLFDGSLRKSVLYEAPVSATFVVGGPGVTVRVVDRLSEAPVSALAVSAYEKLANGELVWVARKDTDAEGLVKFDLEGLGSGRVFVFRAMPYGRWVYSDEISGGGAYRFYVGRLQVRVVDGTSGAGKANQTVVLRKWSADGRHVRVLEATTDAQGWVRIDPTGGTDWPYVLTAVSPTDGTEKVSAAYYNGGPHTFVLGNAAVRIVLKDALSGTVLPGLPVEALSVSASGQKTRVSTRTTDASGVASFDLDGVGTGSQYVFRAKPYLQQVETPVITNAGEHVLSAGRLKVAVINGSTQTPYAFRDVHLLEALGDALIGVAVFRTDVEGVLRLDPEGMGQRKYVLRASSSIDGTAKLSDVYSMPVSARFVVGNQPLGVRLLDYLSDQPIADAGLDVYQLDNSGNHIWKAKGTTGSDGRAVFDLAELGKGSRYIIKTQPYGLPVVSDVIDATGWFRIAVGTSPVVVTNSESGGALAGVTVSAYEKNADGSLRWAKQGVTDHTGLIRFDLEGLRQGREYVLRALDPFGDGKHYFSNLITQWGMQSFAINAARVNTPDRVPPALSIDEPADGSSIGASGVGLSGTARDDVALREVRATLKTPSGREVELPVRLRPASGTWYAHTGRLDEMPGTVTVRIRAIDKAWNETELVSTLELKNDVLPPVLSVDPEPGGMSVPAGGFVLSGRVRDDTLGAVMRATVSGPGFSGTPRNVDVAYGSGRWALVIAPDAISAGESVTVKLDVEDAGGNVVSTTLALRTDDTYAAAWHVLQRTTFGALGGPYEQMVSGGVPVNTWINQQLTPTEIEDSGLAVREAEWSSPGTNVATPMLRRSIYSDRMLLEVMTWFWDNHFNTYYNSHSNSQFEHVENEAFRSAALGNFRQLLGISARSPAMLYTLDGRNNRRGHPNENYARELMELHTMGVGGGYTQRDVEEVARALTGWTVVDGGFNFDASGHDSATKSVLGTTIPAGGGQSDGDRVLDLVAAHPSTALFICRKLVTYFVSDVPVEALVSRCASTFSAQASAPDQIRQVLRIIFSSPEFLGTNHRGTKLKTPLEFVLGAVRQLGGERAGDDLAVELHRHGMPIFMNALPTGYSDVGSAWLSTNMLHARARFADRLLSYSPATNQTRFDLALAMRDEGFETAEGVCGRLLERLYGPTFLKRHFDLAMDVLTDGGSYPWLPGAPDAETRLRRLGKALLVLPDYQYQ
jgi:5-hydroxyisourate hydrolase-like protein (transthyretin family)